MHLHEVAAQVAVLLIAHRFEQFLFEAQCFDLRLNLAVALPPLESDVRARHDPQQQPVSNRFRTTTRRESLQLCQVDSASNVLRVFAHFQHAVENLLRVIWFEFLDIIFFVHLHFQTFEHGQRGSIKLFFFLVHVGRWGPLLRPSRV